MDVKYPCPHNYIENDAEGVCPRCMRTRRAWRHLAVTLAIIIAVCYLIGEYVL